MKIWIFILLAILFSCNKAYCTAASVINGQVIFVTACGTCAPTTPQDFELNLSTTLYVVIDGKVEVDFDNYSDWLNCQTKAGLRRKYRAIQSIVDSFGVLPAALTQDLKERAGWLRSYYLSLP